MNDCLFCKLVANEIPSYTVYEDVHTRGFLDIFPSTDGHVMVIHKRHEEKITGYTKDELTDLFMTVQKIAPALEEAFDTTILSIGINHGEPKGVHHAHVHIIPRYEDDGGSIMQGLAGRKAREKDLLKIVAKIKEKIGK